MDASIMRIPMYQVDAFTDAVFTGNPAAVCPLSAWPDDALLQSIAIENNLSETAYLIGAAGRYELRWFTPAFEVPLCGHATLASAFVVMEHLEPGRSEVRFDTRFSGELVVTREGARFAMDLPAGEATEAEVDEAITSALGARPVAVSHGARWIARFETEAEIRALEPDFSKVAALDARGVAVTAPGDEVDFVSRYFAPRAGVDEDPVTGAAHVVLAPYWAARLGRARLLARQLSKRGGEVDCEVAGDRVVLRGGAVLYLVGEIMV
jgi:PhzF family phenazine biosynthesis protein